MRAHQSSPSSKAQPDGAVLAGLQTALLGWFAVAQRPLPWRNGYDPYAVWVSEMMLQQTQVEQVLPYFARWMARFPNVAALVAAPQQEVLKLWEGLGYYARARHLHRAAQEIAARHGGRVPDDPEALLALPGIGRYSAGAIASIAFNRPLPVVDGNVARVLSRWFALHEAERSRRTSGSAASQAALWALAESLIPAGRAREFNQALMELGALICRPRDPLCGLCPVRAHCRAFALGKPEAFPAPKLRRERRKIAALLVLPVREGGPDREVLLRRRPAPGLWGGLWEFPWIEANGDRQDRALTKLLRPLGLRAQGKARPLGEVRHGLTHLEFTWQCVAAAVRPAGRTQSGGRGARVDPSAAETCWADRLALAALPLGRPMQKVLALWRSAESEAETPDPDRRVGPQSRRQGKNPGKEQERGQ